MHTHAHLTACFPLAMSPTGSVMSAEMTSSDTSSSSFKVVLVHQGTRKAEEVMLSFLPQAVLNYIKSPFLQQHEYNATLVNYSARCALSRTGCAVLCVDNVAYLLHQDLRWDVTYLNADARCVGFMGELLVVIDELGNLSIWDTASVSLLHQETGFVALPLFRNITVVEIQDLSPPSLPQFLLCCTSGMQTNGSVLYELRRCEVGVGNHAYVRKVKEMSVKTGTISECRYARSEDVVFEILVPLTEEMSTYRWWKFNWCDSRVEFYAGNCDDFTMSVKTVFS